MSAPVAYVLQRHTPADVQLARDLADAGVEVYAFASAEDLLLAAGEVVGTFLASPRIGALVDEPDATRATAATLA